jgi:hypothetical protein
MACERSPGPALAFLGVLTWVVLAAACGPAPDLEESAPPGRRAYLDLKCGNCHGLHLEGKATAPPLESLASHWDGDRLLAYLKEPGELSASTPRLAALSTEYLVEMPPAPTDDEGLLEVLVAYLLEQ